jgi:hypothetical protein
MKPVAYDYILVDLSVNRPTPGIQVTQQNNPVKTFTWLRVDTGASATFSIGASNTQIPVEQDLAFIGAQGGGDASKGVFVQNAIQAGLFLALYVEYQTDDCAGGSPLVVTGG